MASVILSPRPSSAGSSLHDPLISGSRHSERASSSRSRRSRGGSASPAGSTASLHSAETQQSSRMTRTNSKTAEVGQVPEPKVAPINGKRQTRSRASASESQSALGVDLGGNADRDLVEEDLDGVTARLTNGVARSDEGDLERDDVTEQDLSAQSSRTISPVPSKRASSSPSKTGMDGSVPALSESSAVEARKIRLKLNVGRKRKADEDAATSAWANAVTSPGPDEVDETRPTSPVEPEAMQSEPPVDMDVADGGTGAVVEEEELDGEEKADGGDGVDGQDEDGELDKDDGDLRAGPRRAPKRKKRWLKKGEVDPDDPLAVARQKQRHAMIDGALLQLDQIEKTIRDGTHVEMNGLLAEMEKRRALKLEWAEKRHRASMDDLRTMALQSQAQARAQWRYERERLFVEVSNGIWGKMQTISYDLDGLSKNDYEYPQPRHGKQGGGWQFYMSDFITGRERTQPVVVDGEVRQRRDVGYNRPERAMNDEAECDLMRMSLMRHNRTFMRDNYPRYWKPLALKWESPPPPVKTERRTTMGDGSVQTARGSGRHSHSKEPKPIPTSVPVVKREDFEAVSQAFRPESAHGRSRREDYPTISSIVGTSVTTKEREPASKPVEPPYSSSGTKYPYHPFRMPLEQSGFSTLPPPLPNAVLANETRLDTFPPLGKNHARQAAERIDPLHSGRQGDRLNLPESGRPPPQMPQTSASAPVHRDRAPLNGALDRELARGYDVRIGVEADHIRKLASIPSPNHVPVPVSWPYSSRTERRV